MDPWPFLLAALASYRVTRFLVLDTLLENVRRQQVYRRWPPNSTWAQAFGRPVHKLGELVSCSYCLGFWVSGLVLLAAWACGVVHVSPLAAFGLWWALAGAQAFLSAADVRIGR